MSALSSSFLLLLLGFLSASSSSPPALLAGVPAGFRPSGRSVCRPIPNTLSLCHGVGYRLMWLPNLLGHDTVKEIQQQSAAWLPLVSKQCHRDTQKLLCSLYSPVCVPGLHFPLHPCRSLCLAVRDACLPVMSAFGFPWPEMFNCSRFPNEGELCIPPSGEQQQQEPKTPELNPEESSKGSVICDACSLATESESDIQENFCNSPYAFKMRLSSVSTLGGDLQLVPTSRSRILRWAGGGAERAEEVGGAMAHSALWLQEGGSCTCPGLNSAETNKDRGKMEERIKPKPANEEGKLAPEVQSGWFLALAQAEEGRLLVTRLVKWGSGDKELKKFVRALLKLPCPDL